MLKCQRIAERSRPTKTSKTVKKEHHTNNIATSNVSGKSHCLLFINNKEGEYITGTFILKISKDEKHTK